ncbi:hypothetical protein NC651_019837 [Populus alba x Populus x berolinensis]|nr:hypothetical protein NC651_019837 [Populus alba x Populus x berolinensis]
MLALALSRLERARHLTRASTAYRRRRKIKNSRNCSVSCRISTASKLNIFPASLFAYLVALDAMPVPTRYLDVPDLPDNQASMVFAWR